MKRNHSSRAESTLVRGAHIKGAILHHTLGYNYSAIKVIDIILREVNKNESLFKISIDDSSFYVFVIFNS